ncbi:hypothetical protein [Marinobacter sp. OP 3.4]|uniref:hypothetical protein n=1 Tax=Marinobacter sp. OP 3.4 TaxID=3076501 RepID=UPI002E1B2DA7
MITSKIKLAAAAVAITAVFGAGWTAKGWLEDSKELAAMEALDRLTANIREGQREISAQVEQRLSELKANERVIDRGVIREIQKPVYQRVCLPDASIRLLNSAASGEAPGEPADQVPEDAPTPD